jgi:uncharacterized protein
MNMAKYQIYKDTRGEYRARLVAANGEKVWFTEGYSSKQGAKDAIAWNQSNGGTTTVEETT